MRMSTRPSRSDLGDLLCTELCASWGFSRRLRSRHLQGTSACSSVSGLRRRSGKRSLRRRRGAARFGRPCHDPGPRSAPLRLYKTASWRACCCTQGASHNFDHTIVQRMRHAAQCLAKAHCIAVPPVALQRAMEWGVSTSSCQATGRTISRLAFALQPRAQTSPDVSTRSTRQGTPTKRRSTLSALGLRGWPPSLMVREWCLGVGRAAPQDELETSRRELYVRYRDADTRRGGDICQVLLRRARRWNKQHPEGVLKGWLDWTDAQPPPERVVHGILGLRLGQGKSGALRSPSAVPVAWRGFGSGQNFGIGVSRSPPNEFIAPQPRLRTRHRIATPSTPGGLGLRQPAPFQHAMCRRYQGMEPRCGANSHVDLHGTRSLPKHLGYSSDVGRTCAPVARVHTRHLRPFACAHIALTKAPRLNAPAPGAGMPAAYKCTSTLRRSSDEFGPTQRRPAWPQNGPRAWMACIQLTAVSLKWSGRFVVVGRACPGAQALQTWLRTEEVLSQALPDARCPYRFLDPRRHAPRADELQQHISAQWTFRDFCQEWDHPDDSRRPRPQLASGRLIGRVSMCDLTGLSGCRACYSHAGEGFLGRGGEWSAFRAYLGTSPAASTPSSPTLDRCCPNGMLPATR